MTIPQELHFIDRDHKEMRPYTTRRRIPTVVQPKAMLAIIDSQLTVTTILCITLFTTNNFRRGQSAHRCNFRSCSAAPCFVAECRQTSSKIKRFIALSVQAASIRRCSGMKNGSLSDPTRASTRFPTSLHGSGWNASSFASAPDGTTPTCCAYRASRPICPPSPGSPSPLGTLLRPGSQHPPFLSSRNLSVQPAARPVTRHPPFPARQIFQMRLPAKSACLFGPVQRSSTWARVSAR